MLTARGAGTAPPSDAAQVPVPRVLAAFGLRGLGAGFTLVQNALLARVAGAGGLGLYFVSHSWSRVAGTAVGMGLPPYVLRRSAALRRRGRAVEADWLVVRSKCLATVVGLVAAAAALVVLTALHGTGSIGRSTFAVAASAAVGAVAFASTRLLADALKARGEPEAALTVEFSLPNVLLCGVLALVLASGARLSVEWMLAVVTMTVVVVPLLGWSWWDRRPSRVVDHVPSPTDELDDDVVAPPGTALAPRSLANLTALGGLNILLWAQPTLLMPFLFDDVVDIGRFGVAQRVVAVASLNIVALGSHFAPRFAAADAMRQPGALQREVQRAAVLALASYLPFFVVFVVWPGGVLRLFGGGFDQGATLLVIMAVGQLVNAATGLSSEVLVMTGHERYEVASTALGVVAMLVATLLAGTAFGAVGVATAFAGAVALRNTVSFVLMRRVTRQDLHGLP